MNNFQLIKKISIVIPVHNEAGNIVNLHARLCRVTDYLSKYYWEFIYINDELIKQVDEVANDINEPSRTSGSLSRKQVENLQNKTSSISR